MTLVAVDLPPFPQTSLVPKCITTISGGLFLNQVRVALASVTANSPLWPSVGKPCDTGNETPQP
jgi:hypothetical protein